MIDLVPTADACKISLKAARHSKLVAALKHVAHEKERACVIKMVRPLPNIIGFRVLF